MKVSWKPLHLDLYESVRSQPARTGLSFLAIAVGITALTVLLSVLSGLERDSQRIIQELGVNVFGITHNAPRTGPLSDRVLERQHVEFFKRNFPDCVVTGVRLQDVNAPRIGRVKVVATDGALMELREWPLIAGRFIDEGDLADKSRSAVISYAVHRESNVQLGESILLRDTPYEVVGIVDVGGGAIDTEMANQDIVLGEKTVFVPLATPPYWLAMRYARNRIDAIFVRVSDATRYDRVLAASQALLSQPDYACIGLSWITPQTLLVRVRRLQNTIKLTVGSIAVLCLILGGTTLMSLMVANVRERVSEIGLRRTLGATRHDIVSLFVAEACAVTATAASAGVLVTHLVLGAARGRLPVPVHFGMQTVLLPLVVAVGLGIVFSYWPARSAAAIMPSEALRNE